MSTSNPHPVTTHPFATSTTTAVSKTPPQPPPPPPPPSPAQQQQPRPIIPPPPPPSHHHHLYTPQSLPLRSPNSTIVSTPGTRPTHHHHHQDPSPQSQGILYPVASSGRGFMPKHVRPSADQTVTVANLGAYPPPRSVLGYHHRSTGSPHMEAVNHSMHLIRANQPHPHLQNQHPHVGSAPIKGIPVSVQPKVASLPSSVPDGNGHRNSRIRDDTPATTDVIRDRKVRISDGASLYALCRSWLKNGVHEEIQPQYGDGLKSLPRPLPAHVADDNLPIKKEREEEESEEEGEVSVDHLSTEDLLKRHIKRAKKVRARLREERLKRIARYKSRLALLLPPFVEQCRNDYV